MPLEAAVHHNGSVLYRKRRPRGDMPMGFYRFEGPGRRMVYGAGDGEYVRLRDEEGREWSGWVERCDEHTVRYRFRDADGKTISGISDSYGVLLRDERGKTWRGYID